MKRTVILVFIAAFLACMHTARSAETLQVDKIVENTDIKVGDDVKIILKFSNPFGRDIPVRITDKNVLGNNGIDVQCLDYVIPSKGESAISYEPIKPFLPGKYILPPVQVTYTNPLTGKEETAKSEEVEIEIGGSASSRGRASGITTIYRCNGINMQSTSYSSSGSSFNIHVGGGTNVRQLTGLISGTRQQHSFQQRVQESQMSQNANTLKQQLEEQLQRQEKMEQEFRQILEGSPEFQKESKMLLDAGYNLSETSFELVKNDTGTFDFSYKASGGRTAVMRGEMENGTLKSIMSLTEEERQKILGMLMTDREFRKYSGRLEERGFSQAAPLFTQVSRNHTRVTVPYKKGDEEAKITADYINGTIRNVSLEEGGGPPDLWWAFLLALAFAAGILVYSRTRRKKGPEKRKAQTTKKHEDYKTAARKMIEDAKRLFAEGKEKDAYEKVSRTIRFYFSNKFGIKNDIVASELLGHLRETGHAGYSEIRKCLDTCTLVEFAKHRPPKEVFSKITGVAEQFICPLEHSETDSMHNSKSSTTDRNPRANS
jgi:hypothetical protein